MELFVAILAACCALAQAQYAMRTCQMMPNPSLSPTDPLYQNITGTVKFTQEMSNSTTIEIDINLTGFNTTDGLTQHGFHVHQSGVISAGCEGAEGHFNPDGVTHGGPTDDIRHVGDLGNIEEDGSGSVVELKTDSMITFEGTNDITERAIVVHATFDDLGLGNHTDSNTTGHAGARLSCCVISMVLNSASLPLINYAMVATFSLLMCVFNILNLD